jgi:hypothetical protein
VARFVNWLNASTGHSAAYKFTTVGFNDNIALWSRRMLAEASDMLGSDAHQVNNGICSSE